MRITFEGGLNENFNPQPTECQEGYNFDLTIGDTDLKPRRPLDTKGTATLGGDIAGIMQLIKRDDTETTLVFEDDGATPTLYTWDGSTTFTSKRTANLAVGSKLRDTYWSLDDYLVISDTAKLTPLMNWDGADLIRHKTTLVASAAQAVTSITRVSTTATVTTTGSHGYSTGDLVKVIGAVETDYNIEAEITVTGSTTFTYTVAGSPATPATGTITVDFGTELYAKYSIVHDGRVWIFNVKTNNGSTTSDLPHMAVASAYEDPKTFDSTLRSGDAGFSTGNEAFYVLSPDLKPINGVAVFNKELVISTEKGRLYRLTGVDSSDYAFIDYYAGSAATGTESIINIGNDIVYMRQGGNIESLRSTDQYSEITNDDISRWIPDTVRDLSESLSVYDPHLQKVLFFVSGKVLVLFKDVLYAESQLSPWSVYTTELAFDFNTSAARYLRRPSESTWSVYLGDSSGNIYDLNGTGSGDNAATDIITKRKSGPIPSESPADPIFGKVQFRRIGECQANFLFDWADAYNISQVTLTLSGPPAVDSGAYFGGANYFGGDVYFNTGSSFAEKISTRSFSPTGRSHTFTMEAYIETSVRFQIDSIDI